MSPSLRTRSNSVRNREECDALADWRSSEFFDERERAALTYTDVMTREIAVPDPVFAAVKRHFDDRQIVELTVLIGTYNMNARVLRALELDLEPSRPPAIRVTGSDRREHLRLGRRALPRQTMCRSGRSSSRS